jgi:hypothetical protein
MASKMKVTVLYAFVVSLCGHGTVLYQIQDDPVCKITPHCSLFTFQENVCPEFV